MSLQLLMPRTGVWIDDAPSRVTNAGYWDELRDLGFIEAAFMLDTARRRLDPRWTMKQLEKAGILAHDRGFDVALTVWPYPVRSEILELGREMPALIATCGADEWENDAEWNWKPKHVRGYSSIDDAAKALDEQMNKAQSQTGCAKSLSTFTAHTENGRAAVLAPRMDMLSVQAYSVRHRRVHGRKVAIPLNHTYGPTKMVPHTLDRTALVEGAFSSIHVGVGLAAWDQRWPGIRPEDAMQLAYNTAYRPSIRHVRYWSSKWIVGAQRRKTPYAAAFFKRLTAARNG